jgi:hypothetical protein
VVGDGVVGTAVDGGALGAAVCEIDPSQKPHAAMQLRRM